MGTLLSVSACECVGMCVSVVSAPAASSRRATFCLLVYSCLILLHRWRRMLPRPVPRSCASLRTLSTVWPSNQPSGRCAFFHLLHSVPYIFIPSKNAPVASLWSTSLSARFSFFAHVSVCLRASSKHRCPSTTRLFILTRQRCPAIVGFKRYFPNQLLFLLPLTYLLNQSLLLLSLLLSPPRFNRQLLRNAGSRPRRRLPQ